MAATRQKRGRPKIRWKDDVREDLKELGIYNWLTRTQDRSSWKEIVEQAKAFKKWCCRALWRRRTMPEYLEHFLQWHTALRLFRHKLKPWSTTLPRASIHNFVKNLFMWVLINGPLNEISASILSYEGSDHKNSLLNCTPQPKSDGFRTQDKGICTSKTVTSYHTDHTTFFALQLNHCPTRMLHMKRQCLRQGKPMHCFLYIYGHAVHYILSQLNAPHCSYCCYYLYYCFNNLWYCNRAY
jgi:hypothetical protein